MVNKIQRSKRKYLRFKVHNYSIILKSAFDDAVADLLNISAGGCAMKGVTIPLELHEKVLLIIPLAGEAEMEIGAHVIQLADTRVSVKFTEIDDASRQKLILYFARLQRESCDVNQKTG